MTFLYKRVYLFLFSVDFLNLITAIKVSNWLSTRREVMPWKCPHRNETYVRCLGERKAIQRLLSFWPFGSQCSHHFEFLMNLMSSWTWWTGQWHWVKLSATRRKRENFSVSINFFYGGNQESLFKGRRDHGKAPGIEFWRENSNAIDRLLALDY